MTETYFRYWGKAEKDGPEYHLLPYHCLDVAAVVDVWLRTSDALGRSLLDGNVSQRAREQLRGWILFFVALHDYGKFDLRFQLKVPEIRRHLLPADEYGRVLPTKAQCANYRHGESGLFWFRRDFTILMGFEPGDDTFFLDESDPPQWASWKAWMEAVAGHHGYVQKAEYVKDATMSSLVDPRLSERDKDARLAWINALERLFLTPVALSIKDMPLDPSPLLAGLCSVADWLASRCTATEFPFQKTSEPLKDYFERKREDAHRVIELAGIDGTPKSYHGVQMLLPDGASVRPLQALIDALPMQTGLTIIEAPTGAGKTEAALSYAWRLLAGGLADSVVFALPTQATANAMLDRLEVLANRLFVDSPNLLLAHGSARFNESFARLKKLSAVQNGEPDGWAQCSEWLAESRKRVFLGQIGVCTIDQVLVSVLPVKHRFVRGFGLGRGVLIIDEVHAYDAYMYCLLEQTLRQQRAAGSSAILLSATLPAAQKRQLIKAWGREPEEEISPDASYPLVTWTGDDVSCLFQTSETRGEREVLAECEVTEAMLPDDKLLERLGRAAAEGAQVAVICNLVKDAQKIYHDLQAWGARNVGIFHARYRFKDRQASERAIIQQFGPKSVRAKGRILVATQVVEQSLDLDFDWIVTQLCPVDLLFQRMGRLHRHSFHSRPAGFSQARCTVLLPVNNHYGYTGNVYANHRVLWRTEQMLRTATSGKVSFPEAYRAWIEKVYNDKPWQDEPLEITEAHEKYCDDLFVSRNKALQQVYSAMNPFPDDDQAVATLTRDGEMNVTLIPFVNSDGGQTLLDGEMIDDIAEFHKPEELAMNGVPAPGRWRQWLAKMGKFDEEGRFWLEMTKADEGFEAKGNNVLLRYRHDTGLERSK